MRKAKSQWIGVVLMTLSAAVALGQERDGGSDAEESLRAAEMSFAASVAEKDWVSFGEHIDRDAVFIGGQPTVGKQAILDAWQVYFNEDAPVLVWKPEQVFLRPDGKTGLTRGPYELRVRNQGGEEKVQKGTFTSIWELQKDGRWRVVFDAGCAPCPECESPEGAVESES